MGCGRALFRFLHIVQGKRILVKTDNSTVVSYMYINRQVGTRSVLALRSMREFISIDLFASHRNHQLPVYCSLARDDNALACDAMSIDWTGMAAYAYPPISLLSQVLIKIQREDCIVLLVAPGWSLQAWFYTLMQLLVDIPISLPSDKDTLRIPRSKLRFRGVCSSRVR